LRSLIEKKVEDIDLEFFSQLDSSDILFIDSSHTVKIGGDVNYLFLEVLPRLKPGVIVHVHDIFLPFDYRRDWVKDQFRFWTEQYLLQAFLSFNAEFKVLMCNSYLGLYYVEDMKSTFPNSPWWADTRIGGRVGSEAVYGYGDDLGDQTESTGCACASPGGTGRDRRADTEGSAKAQLLSKHGIEIPPAGSQ